METNIRQAIASELAAIRGRAGVTQRDLAERSGLNRATVHRKSRGLRALTLEEVVLLAPPLGLTPAQLAYDLLAGLEPREYPHTAA